MASLPREEAPVRRGHATIAPGVILSLPLQIQMLPFSRLLDDRWYPMEVSIKHPHTSGLPCLGWLWKAHHRLLHEPLENGIDTPCVPVDRDLTVCPCPARIPEQRTQ